jgi:hypothetical protein
MYRRDTLSHPIVAYQRTGNKIDQYYLYIGSAAGIFACINIVAGTIEWTYSTGYAYHQMDLSPAIDKEGTIYFGTTHMGNYFCALQNMMTPSPPEDLKAVGFGMKKILLTWKDSSPKNAKPNEFEIFRCGPYDKELIPEPKNVKDLPFEIVGSVKVREKFITLYIDSKLKKNKWYYYYVRGKNEVDEPSGPSNIARGKTLATDHLVIPYNNIFNLNYEKEVGPIKYVVPADGNVRMVILSLSGQLVKVLVNKKLKAGVYGTEKNPPLLYWDVRNAQGKVVASGTYLINITVIPDLKDLKPYYDTNKIVVFK